MGKEKQRERGQENREGMDKKKKESREKNFVSPRILSNYYHRVGDN